jgi:hypothetical protein
LREGGRRSESGDAPEEGEELLHKIKKGKKKNGVRKPG